MKMFLTVKNTAKFFGRAEPTIYRWIKNGWIQPLVLKVGGSQYYQFTIDNLIAFYEGQMSRAEIQERLDELKKRENICPFNGNNPPQRG